MDEILDHFRDKLEIQRRREAGLPEDWDPVKTLPEKPTFRGEDLPGGLPTKSSLPFFPLDPGIHPDSIAEKKQAYFRQYANSAPETVEKLLSEKEEAFCQHYAITRNGGASARAAGWSAGSARTTAYRLLLKNAVRQRITHLMQFQYYNDQATPVHAMALVMSALQGGPDPALRLRAARTILDIYKASGHDVTEAESMLPASSEEMKKSAERPHPEAKLLNNNTFIQINTPPVSTNVHTASTNVHKNR